MKKAVVILAHAFVGWALCAAVMGIGIPVLGLPTTLIVHAIAAPVLFGLVAWNYFTRFRYTNPPQTAVIFTSFVMATDLILVAMVIQKSLAMFSSLIGTWIPFALIFASTYGVGILTHKKGI